MSSNILQSKLLVLARQPAGRLPGPDYLGQNYFILTIVAAVLLHLAGLYLWMLSPKIEVVDIPVHALNIKLGDGEFAAEEAKPVPAPESKSDSGHNVSRLVREDNSAEQARAQSVIKSMDKAITTPSSPAISPPASSSPAPRSTPVSPSRAKVVGKFDRRVEADSVAAPVMPVVAHQFVRDVGAPATGDAPGSSNARDAEMISRYTQVISLWIQKFQVYPSEAHKKGLEGDTVVRIRIDRQGNIGYYILEHSTGYEELDHAAIDMIRRANPVPAVPADYPPGDILEFLVPVTFHLQ
jgi:TonB family protein